MAWLFTWEKLLNIFCIICNSVKILIRWARLVKPSPVIKEIERKARYLKHTEKSKEQEALDWLIFLITGGKNCNPRSFVKMKKRKEVETIFCWNEQEQNSSDSYACVVDLMRNPHIFLINFDYSDYYPLLAQFIQYITAFNNFQPQIQANSQTRHILQKLGLLARPGTSGKDEHHIWTGYYKHRNN